jgi:solute:Na+ symporter, SSS family
LSGLDFLVVLLFLVITYLIAFLSPKKESTLKSHFQSSGSLGWFVSGTAMVATTFAADTPLAVTELVAKYGISGNWLWWYMGFSSITTVYFFAPLWKRSGVLTDVELVKLRYDGKGSDVLRIFKSIYMGIFLNTLILSWVNLSMLKISEVLFPEYSAKLIVSSLFLFAFIYTALMGLTGISYADTFQFFLAMLGCFVLSVLVIGRPEIGGIEGLKEKLEPHYFNFLPSFTGEYSPFSLETFLVFVTVIWWASWYPGAEPGGGGYIAQRILASKDIRSSMLASLWFTIAHYFVRPWPWILVALASLVLYPNLGGADKSKGFVFAMKDSLPPGLFGLLVAGFLAAYLSTVATHLNWGTSYLINDFYKPYISRDKSDSFYLRTTKIFESLLMIFSLVISFYFIETISGVWRFLLECGAGSGLVLILRWYIPRINAYSELSGFLFPSLFYILGTLILKIPTPYSILFTVGGTLITVLLVTFFTKPTESSSLKKFYEKVNPPGLMWEKWRIENGIDKSKHNVSLSHSLLLSIVGLVLIYSGLFSLGSFILKNYVLFFIHLSIFLISIFITYKIFPNYEEIK